MSEEKRRTIEVDEDFLETLYGLVGKIPPGEKNINIDLLKDLVLDIRRKIDRLETELQESPVAARMSNMSVKSSGISLSDDEFDENTKRVLVIDDLGVITYQLSVLFKNVGYDVTISKEMFDAIDKYKKHDYDVVIMDLYIPTEREGLMLLDELVKLFKIKKYTSKIGVMTASSKKEHRQVCLKKGADFYIEKIDDWQSAILDFALNTNQR